MTFKKILEPIFCDKIATRVVLEEFREWCHVIFKHDWPLISIPDRSNFLTVLIFNNVLVGISKQFEPVLEDFVGLLISDHLQIW